MNYRFLIPESPAEAELIFTLVEDRGDRALFVCAGRAEQGELITPTFCYRKADMIQHSNEGTEHEIS